MINEESDVLIELGPWSIPASENAGINPINKNQDEMIKYLKNHSLEIDQAINKISITCPKLHQIRE
jgi:hypothetical protein